MSLSPIELISSSSYPIPKQWDRGERTVPHANILYGGLSVLSYDDEAVSAPTTTGSRRKLKRNTIKKKKSGEKLGDDDSKPPKRRRGRPRVLNQDENAAERRRTQIRLAQRAYRSRKEATIASLSKQLSELDAAIRDMNTSVGNFRDELMGSGMLLQHTSLMHGIQELVQKSDALAKLSAGSDDDESANPLPTPMDDTADNYNSSSVEAGDASFADQSPETTKSLDEFSLPLFTTTDNTSSTALDSLFQNYDALDNFQQAQQATTLSEDPSIPSTSFSQDLVNVHVETSRDSWLQHTTIPAPTTYSFLEPTFRRRLRRKWAEYGYRLLTDPNSDPMEVYLKTRFSLCFRNKQSLIERLWTVISSAPPPPPPPPPPPSSSSSTTTTSRASISASYTLGNAGIHYPRQHESLTAETPTKHYPVSKFIGPWAFHQAVWPHEFTTIDEIISARGMKGDWFDVFDVEGYLRARGIQIDTQASFVTLPDGIPSLSADQSVDSSSTEGKEYYSSRDDGSMMIDPSLMTLDSSKLLYEDGSREIDIPTKQQSSTRIFDVDMFIAQLTRRGVCLGEKPGYRKQDVEECLHIACYAVA